MSDKKNLLSGSIFSSLTALALPIMGTSFLNMAYHLVDMVWIGILGSGAVASIGIAGYFITFSMALVRLVQVGTEVNIAQSIGAENGDRANYYAGTALRMAVGIALIYGLVLYLFNRQLIGFFRIDHPLVERDARHYLMIMSLGMVFVFLNPIITCIYNGAGYSKAPFKVNAMGMAANMVLDPLMIFGLNLGVRGAALATVFSQMLVTLVLVRMLIRNRPFPQFRFRGGWSSGLMREIGRLGAPVALQSGLFSVYSVLLARIVAGYGPAAMAAQKVGVQIESISYMTAHGFAIALSSFTGQNMGAGKPGRVKQGIKTAGGVMFVFGVITSLILVVFARELFMIFIREEATVVIGTRYVRILGFSQLFMCLEITFSGGFNGLRKTTPPALVSILFTGLRVPAAYLLARESLLGLDGVWWTITGSSWIKGTLMAGMTLMLLRSPLLQTGHPTIAPGSGNANDDAVS
ncbi:MATE family efflux transporter [Anoxynatronum buryatiense]|uniref:Probable multidrug resistance protein NorM n=1 Tax=Anoxynatronum buryatiense TaxID=489973 RepID=A0AA45WZI8_9CLOT|nr:MATE family efflux transporter [Anoxynatronum buryatiense]SMP68266.1 putative efflux protein, MATE family [Anoxynatronum buryatiense]